MSAQLRDLVGVRCASIDGLVGVSVLRWRGGAVAGAVALPRLGRVYPLPAPLALLLWPLLYAEDEP